MLRLASIGATLALACSPYNGAPAKPPKAVPESLRAESRMVAIPAGTYRRGSTEAERERAYEDYLGTSGRDTARRLGWFRRELAAAEHTLPGYRFDLHPVTQSAFAEFLRDTHGSAPTMSRADWEAQGFIQDYDSEVARFNWSDGRLPSGREHHPVVLVPWAQAQAYCRWRGQLVGHERFLPSADEFEKAARGPSGSAYPWGQHFDASKLNSAVGEVRDTTPVEAYPQGVSASGVLGTAGNIFHWTRSPWPHGTGRMTVKGSAWDDWGGLGRAAAAHGRKATARHVIVGFRCAGPLD